MDQIAKVWKKISEKDRKKIRLVLSKIQKREFSDLGRKKLKGYESIYRVRIGDYRLIYYDDGQEILLKYLKKRDEKTYREL